MLKSVLVVIGLLSAPLCFAQSTETPAMAAFKAQFEWSASCAEKLDAKKCDQIVEWVTELFNANPEIPKRFKGNANRLVLTLALQDFRTDKYDEYAAITKNRSVGFVSLTMAPYGSKWNKENVRSAIQSIASRL